MTSRSSRRCPACSCSAPGLGLFISTVTTAAVTRLDESRASLGGAILYMFQVAGGAVGLALTTAIFAGAANDRLLGDAAKLGLSPTDQQVQDAQGILAGTDSAAAVVAQLPADASRIVQLAQDAFVDALRVAFRVDAVISVVAVVVAVLFIGGRRHRRAADTP